MSKPLAIDIFCGLGGWTEGALAAGYDVVGFDIERHTAMMPTTIEDDLVAFAGSKGTKPVDKRGWTAGTAIAMGIEGPSISRSDGSDGPQAGISTDSQGPVHARLLCGGIFLPA